MLPMRCREAAALLAHQRCTRLQSFLLPPFSPQYAAARVGAVLVNLNPSLKAAGVRSAYSSLHARLMHPCCFSAACKSCAALPSEASHSV